MDVEYTDEELEQDARSLLADLGLQGLPWAINNLDCSVTHEAVMMQSQLDSLEAARMVAKACYEDRQRFEEDPEGYMERLEVRKKYR